MNIVTQQLLVVAQPRAGSLNRTLFLGRVKQMINSLSFSHQTF